MSHFRLLFDALASARLAIAVLTVLLALCILGSALPQSSDPASPEIRLWQERHPWVAVVCAPLGGFDMYWSWSFLTTLAIFFVNLLACTIKRAMSQRRFAQSPWSKDGSVYWGFLTIHTSLLLLILGAIVNQGFGGTGEFVVKENMGFWGGRQFGFFRDGFLLPARSEPPRLDFALFCKTLTPVYADQVGTKTDIAVEIVAAGGHRIPRVIGVNRPLSYGGYDFMVKEYGFAPHIVLRETGGRTIAQQPALMYPAEQPELGKENLFFAPPCKFKIELYPDATAVDATALTVQNRSFLPHNPVFVFTLWEAERLLGRALLRYDKTGLRPQFCQIGKYELGVAGLEYWCAFAASRSPGLFFVYFSMWLCVAGFGLRYLRIFT